MNAYRVSPANRRIVLLAVMSLIASLLTINFNAPGAGAADETISFGSPSQSVDENVGGVLTIPVTLNYTTPLAGDVTATVAVSGNAEDGSDYTVAGTDIEFLASSSPPDGATDDVVVTLGANDNIYEGPETIILTLTAASGATIVAEAVHTITINDDEAQPSIAVAATMSVGEAGTSAAVLVSKSGVDTEAPITFSYGTTDTGSANAGTDYTTTNGSDGSIAPTGTSDTINVPIASDAFVEGDETFLFSISGPSSNATISNAQNTVTITDDDAAGVVVTESGGSSTVVEGGATDSYTVVLTSQPTNNVTITVAPDADLTTDSGGTLTFIPAEWDTAQTVVITAFDDDLVEGAHTGVITQTAASSDSDYNGIGVANITANITDNDAAGVVVTESGGSSTVVEGGATDSYTVVLTSQPTNNVTITVAPDADLTTDSGGTLTFIPAEWDTAQTVVITAFDDDLVEGAHTGVITQTAASSDSDYNGIGVANITANITDNDSATVAFQDPTSDENEAATPHDIPVVLSIPGGGTLDAEVTVAIPVPGGSATGSGTDYTLSTPLLTFPVGSGDGASETVSLAINDDSTVESSETVTFALGTVTGPASASGTTSHIHTITDNDIATVAYTNASSNAAEETSPHTLTVTLDIAGTPGATLASAVTVPITDTGGSAGGSDYDLDTTSVTFSIGSGDGATRTVSLTINDDAAMESNETIGLGFGTPTAPVTAAGQTTHIVTIIDDESRNLTVTPSSGSTVVSEAAGVDTFTVRLTQAPLSGTVTVNLSKSAEGDEFTVSPAQLTFSTDWATPKTVTVTGVNDDIVDGDRAGEILLSASGGGYNGVTATESVTITDDDVAGVTITESGGTSVVEGGATDTYTIVLDAEPTANVVVTLTSDDEITTSPESVTFTPSNWNNPRTITVSGEEDGIDELEEDHTITHTVSSADLQFHNVPVGSVVVSVEDSDELVVVIGGPSVGAPGVASTFEATVNAGGTGTITYQWTAYLGGDPVDSGTSASFEFTPTEGGIYLIEAIVGDSQEQNPAVFIQFRVLGDIGTSIFVEDIVWLAEEGITRGCNPPLNTEYCPTQFVTREQMAAFLVRFLGLTDDGGGNTFVDDDDSIFQDDIAKLAAAGITRGCNPPANTNFCPTQSVTREQMAAFLVRALELTDNGGGNTFVDDDDSIFQEEIARLAAAGITRGCNPPANTNFCPTQSVTRGQMAAFLRRADAIVNP